MNAEDLAEMIAYEINAQNEGNTDNLGDNESLILTGKLPVVNVLQLAENILRAIQEK